MEIYQRPRQGGKTHHAITWWMHDPQNRVIVTFNEGAAHHIREQVKERLIDAQGPSIGRHLFEKYATDRSILSIQTIGQSKGINTKSVYIDNADVVLQSLVGPHRIDGLTING